MILFKCIFSLGALLVIVKDQNFDFLGQNIGYQRAPKRYCQLIVDWPKNQRKIEKKRQNIGKISEISYISAKFRDYISCVHVLEFLEIYRRYIGKISEISDIYRLFLLKSNLTVRIKSQWFLIIQWLF